MFKRLMVAGFVAALGAAGGGYAGAIYAGNHAQSFAFLGAVGYEAGLMLGSLLGLIGGGLLGVFLATLVVRK